MTGNFDIQPYNLDGLKNVLGVRGEATHNEVFSTFEQAVYKTENDLPQGFTVWVNENDLGSTAVYNAGHKNSWFLAKRMIINGQKVREEVAGNYPQGKTNVSISVDRETGSPFVSCRVFVDGSLVASRTSPADWAGQQADAFTRQVAEAQGDDPSRLDKTLGDDRSPYPFAMKMLNDFANSKPDQRRIEQMFNKMKQSHTTVKNSDYLMG